VARKPIRRFEEDSSRKEEPVLDLPRGAHLKMFSPKLYDPKFGEDGALWVASIFAQLKVIDDNEDGEGNDKVFGDKFELKFDPELLHEIMNEHGWEEYSSFYKSNKRDFDEDEIEDILDIDSWGIGPTTKADNMLACTYGRKWKRRKVQLYLEDIIEDLDGAEFRASVRPRTGKRAGSYCAWDSFMAVESSSRDENPRPKKTRKKADGTDYRHSDTADLAPEDEDEMNRIFGSVSDEAEKAS
jgi:hypothetical protein